MERLFSKYGIASITIGRLEPTKFKVEHSSDGLTVFNKQLNRSGGWLPHFLGVSNREIGANIYAYKPEINKDWIISLPFAFIEFMTGEVIKHVFNTDEELDKYLTEHGLKKMINSNHFFDPYKRTF